jgi:exosortase B
MNTDGAALPPSVRRSAAPREPLLPSGLDWPAFTAVVLGFAILFVPFYVELARTIWATDEQGHGPIILVVSGWLLFRRRHDIAALGPKARPVWGWTLLVFALALYVLGAAQSIIMFVGISQILVLAALMLLFRGAAALRLAFFPLFFLLFMIPLPEALVAAVTAPLKSAVSAVATNLLAALGYPVGRSGVIMTVGPYQLLVADACAGLNSMFTLEALGLLYMNLMSYTSISRNATLALLLIPIAFAANVVRVLILVLVTYHFGDEAGQGFVHGFAGMVLFLVALCFMLMTDKFLGTFMPARRRASA